MKENTAKKNIESITWVKSRLSRKHLKFKYLYQIKNNSNNKYNNGFNHFFKNYFKRYFNKKILSILGLGFAAGLPLPLCSNTLAAWFAVSNVDILTISLLTLASQPYVYKFVWSPLFDSYQFHFLGRRRGWLFILQISLALSLLLVSQFDPLNHSYTLIALAGFIAFLSASQDICFDAYKAEVLDSNDRGLGAAIGVEGYRWGMIVSGSFALILADLVGWHITYIIMAGFMLIGSIFTFFATESNEYLSSQYSIKETILNPFILLWKQEYIILFIILIILYRLSDSYIGTLSNTFFIRELGLSLTEVGVLNKILGLIASFIGILCGGLLMTKINLYQALMSYTFLQLILHFLYFILSLTGKYYAVIICAMLIENIFAGMGSAALVVLLMGLCHKRYTATQFAILSSFAATSRVYFTPLAGKFIVAVNWTIFYACMAILVIPCLLLIRYLKAPIERKFSTHKISQ